MGIFSKLVNKLTKGHERSVRAKKNIVAMIFLKGLSILISLLLVPITINYVDTSTYGIWLTISSIITWISFFDIGLNNGLRNKFAEAKANGDICLVQKYVSTTYAVLTMIFIPFLIIFIIINQFIDWSLVLNINSDLTQTLSTSMLIVMSFFSFKFILSTINVIITADQKPAEASLRALIENCVSLVVIFLLTQFTDGSLINLCLGLCVAPIAILTLFNVTLFRGRYKEFRPTLNQIDFKVLPSLFNLGFKFFVIQIAMIIQYQTANLIIIRYLGEESVTLYNITYKYFNVLLMFVTILTTPVWSAVTEARTKSDDTWILSMVEKYRKITWLVVGIGIIMVLVSEFVFKIWINKPEIGTSYILSFAMLIYMLSNIVGKVEGLVLNGLGYLKIQMMMSIISPFIFLALAYTCIRYLDLGIYSVLIAGIVANFNRYLIGPIQYAMVYKYGKKGIWIK